MPAASRTARRQMSSVPEHSLNTEGRSTTSDLEDHCASCPPTRLQLTSRPPSRAYPSTCTRSSTPTASSSSTPACSTRRRSWTRKARRCRCRRTSPRRRVRHQHHLHFDHCGGNRLFPGVPIHVQRLELQGPHDPHEWVDFPVRPTSSTTARQRCSRHPAAATPGHTNGHQSVLVDTSDGLVVIGGDVAYTYDELGSGATKPDNGACSP